MIPAESVGLPLPHIAFVGIVIIVSVLIVCSVSHIATRTMSVMAALVWRSVVEELHGSLLPVDYPLILTQSSIMPVKYDCTCKVLHITFSTCHTCAMHDACQHAYECNLFSMYA